MAETLLGCVGFCRGDFVGQGGKVVLVGFIPQDTNSYLDSGFI